MGRDFDYREWYPNSQTVYATDHSGDHSRLVRLSLVSRKKEDVLNLESVNSKAQVCWMITPPEEASLLISCAVPNGDIYALDVDLP